MPGTIRTLHSDIDTQRILNEINFLLEEYSDATQISLYSRTGDNNWFDGIGYQTNPQSFNKINKLLKNSYTQSILSLYKGYYRWRILKLTHKQNYTIHTDKGDVRNLNSHYRIHIPIITNPNALILFFGHGALSDDNGIAKWYNLKAGKSYLFNASFFHTALNGGHQDRIHLVGQKSK